MSPSILQTTLCSIVLAVALAPAVVRAEEERTGAPYFAVRAGGGDVLPLRETRADVAIAGVIARVRVTQVWENTGSAPIEAVYVFPGSTRSAVTAMRMKIGARTIEAKIAERKAARETYERAKEAGQSASLLEQQRPNVFTMNVANILPGDRIDTILEYSELIVPENGIYALVYPTVVGPRYVGAASAESAATDATTPWTASPYLAEGQAPTYRWGMSVRLAAGLPVREVRSPSHRISPRFEDARRVTVEVDDERGGNRDFVLEYRLDGERIEAGMLLYPGAAGEESFFLMMVEPPQRIEPTEIPAREYIFIVDVSGSMGGFPLDTAKRALTKLLEGLRTQDRFNVMFFSGGNAVLAPKSLAATPDNVARGLAMIAGARGGGGTEIVPALKQALAMPRAKDVSTTFVVVTDGYVTVEKELFGLVRDNLAEANLFALGIGRSVNRLLIEGLARAGLGQPFFALGPGEADQRADELLRVITTPVLTKASVRFEGFDAYDVEPPSIPDVFSARPVVVFGKYRGDAKGRVVLRGSNGGGPVERTLRVADFAPSDDHVALRALWARDRIQRLSDHASIAESDVNAEQVKKLGLKYSLLTAHTSFVAVDSLVRNHGGAPVTVEQPLPLPAGVPNAAVGGLLGASSGYGAASGYGSGGGGLGTVMGLGGLGTRGTGAGGGGRKGSAPAVRVDGGEGKMGGKSARVAAGDTIVAGALSSDVIQSVMRRQQARVRVCYQRALAKAPTLAGRIVARLSIGADGRVLAVELTADAIGDADLAQCLVRTLRSYVFPASPDGSAITVTYPFTFSPG
ncbi:AgmX/PglI C-terminal domain-containing protein [Myxococcota bacterium]|nr:AgmX/PglI C-terminal domain-containing protein [Myxococcota bacterium]